MHGRFSSCSSIRNLDMKGAEYLITYCMEQSPSWEADCFSASQESYCMFWSSKVHYHIHNCLLPVPILSHIDPVHALTSHLWRSILILSSHLCLGLPSGLFHTGIPTKTLYMPLFSPIHATWPAHYIILGLITWTILGEEYRSLSSSLCNLLHSPVTLSFLGPNILLNTLSLQSSLNVGYQVSCPYTTGKVIVLYILLF